MLQHFMNNMYNKNLDYQQPVRCGDHAGHR